MEQTSEVDPNNDTLHISGLNKDPGGVINPNSIMAALSNSSAIESIRLPPGKAFGFIQFTSHDDAVKALNTTSGGLNISGVFLSLKWAAHASSGHDSKRPRKETVLEKVRMDKNCHRVAETGYNSVPRVLTQRCNQLRDSLCPPQDCPDSEMLFFTYPKTVPAIMFQECAEHLRKVRNPKHMYTIHVLTTFTLASRTATLPSLPRNFSRTQSMGTEPPTTG